jgi:hypothetical protein
LVTEWGKESEMVSVMELETVAVSELAMELVKAMETEWERV